MVGLTGVLLGSTALGIGGTLLSSILAGSTKKEMQQSVAPSHSEYAPIYTYSPQSTTTDIRSPTYSYAPLYNISSPYSTLQSSPTITPTVETRQEPIIIYDTKKEQAYQASAGATQADTGMDLAKIAFIVALGVIGYGVFVKK